VLAVLAVVAAVEVVEVVEVVEAVEVPLQEALAKVLREYPAAPQGLHYYSDQLAR
jgi:hypothetical protein